MERGPDRRASVGADRPFDARWGSPERDARGDRRAASDQPRSEPRTAPAHGSLPSGRGSARSFPADRSPPDRRRGLLAHRAGGPGNPLSAIGPRRIAVAAAEDDGLPRLVRAIGRARPFAGGGEPGGILAGAGGPA